MQVGNFAIDNFYKDWDIWTQFVNQYTNRALQLDSLETSHPIEVTVERSSQVNEIFDEISYCKGAACIMMITSYLGMELFRKGICAYLEKHKYGNARNEDLWAALAEASGKDVKAFTTVWTKEVGYPVVSISRGDDGKLVMEQARFLSNGKTLAQTNQWWVPMTLLDSEGKTVSYDLRTACGSVPGTASMSHKWVKGNSGQSAFFVCATRMSSWCSWGRRSSPCSSRPLTGWACSQTPLPLPRPGSSRPTVPSDSPSSM